MEMDNRNRKMKNLDMQHSGAAVVFPCSGPQELRVRGFSLEMAHEWDEFVLAQPHGTFFQLTGWKRVLEKTFGYEACYFYTERAGTITAIAPLFLVSNWLMGQCLLSVPLGVYGGICAADEESKQALLAHIQRLSLSQQVDFLELRNRNGGAIPGFHRNERYATFTTALSPDTESLFKGFPRDTRYMIRKAQKAGLRVRRGMDQLGSFYEMFAESMRRLGTPVFPLSLFENLQEEFGDRMDLLLVYSGEKPVSGVISFFFRDTILPYYAGAAPEAPRLAANNFMYWELMKDAALSESQVRIGGSCLAAPPPVADQTNGPAHRQVVSVESPHMNVLEPTHDLAMGGRSVKARTLEGHGPIRVLHVIDRMDVGGTELGILKVMRGLGSGVFEQRICTARGFDPEMARQQNLEDKLLVAGRSGSGLQLLLFRLIRVMRAYRPHIVHSRNWGAIEAIPAARLVGVPVAIHSEHGYEVETIAGIPTRRRIFRRAAYAMADAVFTVSEELRAYHAKQAWFSQQHIRVIHNGVDTSRFSPRPEIQQEVRRRFGLGTHAFVVGAVGRMVSIKNYHTLLRAAELLAGKGVDLQVVFVGSGPELSGLQQAVEASANLSGRVTFLGTVRDTAEILNAMDAFVLPSLSEGMSNTVLEAMASGLAVVATNVGGNPELVVDSNSGYLFPAGDFQALGSVLEELSRDPERRRHAGQAARRRALDEFSLDGMISNYRNLYLELAARHRVPVPKGA